MIELCPVPAYEFVHLMSSRTASCRVVIKVHLARIDAVNRSARCLWKPTQKPAALPETSGRMGGAVNLLGKAHGLLRWQSGADVSRG